MLKGIVFSERAALALIAEVHEHIETETGGVFLGHRFGNIWYIVEVVDPGINCTLEKDYYENDDIYQTHLMNKINRLYEKDLEILGIWHRHPGSFDTFSCIDDTTNMKQASKHKDGALSALVNIDPDFRLSIYHVTAKTSESRPEYCKISDVMIGDGYFPPTLQRYISVEKYLKSIKGNRNTSFSNVKTCDNRNKSKKFSFVLILEKYLNDEKIRQIYEKHEKSHSFTDDEIEFLLEKTQLDFDFFNEAGISSSLSKRENDGIEVKINECETDVSFVMFVHEGKIFFKYRDKIFEYFQGMFREAFEYITLIGV